MWKGRREAWARWGGRVEGMGFPRRLLARLHRCGGAGRSTRRMLKLVGLVGSIAACLRLLEMEIGTNAIGLPFWLGESEVAGVELLVPFRLGAALVGGRIRQKEGASA